MRVIIKNHSFIIKDRREVTKIIEVELRPLMRKGDHLVWTKATPDAKLTNRVSIVDIGGIVKLTAQITGGSKVAKEQTKTVAKKKVVASKSTKAPATGKTVVAKKAAAKKVAGPSKKELLAKVLLALPKKGKTIDELNKISGMNTHDIRFLCSFQVCMGTVVVNKDQVSPV